MKLKTNFKILLMFGIMLGVILFLGTTKVEASVVVDSYKYTTFGIVESGVPTEDCLKDINNISVNLKETEFYNSGEEILNQIITEFNKKGIVVKKVNWEYEQPTLGQTYLVISVMEPKKADISIRKNQDNNYKDIAHKNISLNYSNSSNYNENDKKYVDNLLNKMDSILVQCIELGSKTPVPSELLKQQIKDNDITFVGLPVGGGSGNVFSTFYSTGFAVFKNNIYYDSWVGESGYTFKITVPNNIEDTNYINYSIPKIKSYLDTYYNEEYKGTVTLKKISGYYYKILLDGKYEDNIIIRKQEGTPIGNNIFVNNLPINVNVTVTPKENNTMETEIKNKGYSKILGSYELNLTGTDKLESPIDITFNVGTENNGKTIYILHQKKNGTYENFEKKVTDGKVTVTVSELSPFVLGIKEENKKPVETTPTTTPTQTVGKGEKDETPKTGTVDIIGYVGLITLVSLVGIVELKKRLK